MSNRRYWTIIRKEDYDAADAVLSRFYEQGCIDSVKVDRSVGGGQIMLGIECASNDLLDIVTELEHI